MARVKVKFRPSSVEGKKGTVFYQVTHKRELKNVVSDVYLLPREWEAVNRRKRAAVYLDYVPEDLLLNAFVKRINEDLFQLHTIMENLETEESAFTVGDIVNRFRGFSCKSIYILSFFDEQVDLLDKSGKLGLSRNYQCVARIFSMFLDGKDIPIGHINVDFVCRFNSWLEKRGVIRNSISCYMRVIRSIYNKAVKKSGAMSANPFANVYTCVDTTVKRAINEHLLRKLYRLELTHKPNIRFARDLFLFSYFTRGMAFVDIAYLRMDNICGKSLSYTRKKTGQRLNVFIEPCVMAIIKKYHKPESIYVFPFIESTDEAEAFLQYQSALSLYNKRLKSLSAMLGQDVSLSSYTARHTWATSARNSKVPLSVISAGMGHTSEQTTRIYLDSLENSVIDKANRGLIARLRM